MATTTDKNQRYTVREWPIGGGRVVCRDRIAVVGGVYNYRKHAEAMAARFNREAANA